MSAYAPILSRAASLTFLARPLWLHQQGAAAVGRAATAGVALGPFGPPVAVALEVIVIGELFAGADVADDFDEDAAVFVHRLAVGVAGVIDKARFIAVHGGVDDGA